MTLEKNVAIVVMLTYLVVALSFSSARNVGKAIKQVRLLFRAFSERDHTPFSEAPQFFCYFRHCFFRFAENIFEYTLEEFLRMGGVL